MKTFKPINLEKQKNIINKSQGQLKFTEPHSKDHFWKSMILIGVINVFHGLMTFEKYFMSEELTYITVQEAINWLKKHGIWNHLVSLGKAAAIELCASHFPRNICTNIVNSF